MTCVRFATHPPFVVSVVTPLTRGMRRTSQVNAVFHEVLSELPAELDGSAEAQAVQSRDITLLSSCVVSWCPLCCCVILVHSSWHTNTPDSHIRTRFLVLAGVDGLTSVAGGNGGSERKNQARREITKEVTDSQVLFGAVSKVPRDSRNVQSLNKLMDYLIRLPDELKD